MASILHVSSSTVRSASKEGAYLNKIDDLEQEIRGKDLAIYMLQKPKEEKTKRGI